MAYTYCHSRYHVLHPEISRDTAAALDSGHASWHRLWRSRKACRSAEYAFSAHSARTLLAIATMQRGILLLAGLEEGLKFSPSAFFYGLLPPIVFAAGFTLKKREFFRNIGTAFFYSQATTYTLHCTLSARNPLALQLQTSSAVLQQLTASCCRHDLSACSSWNPDFFVRLRLLHLHPCSSRYCEESALGQLAFPGLHALWCGLSNASSHQRP